MSFRFASLAGVLLLVGCSSGGSGGSGGTASPAKCSNSGKMTCPNGAAVQVCETTNPDNSCKAAYYSVGAQTFDCASCTDCTQAIQSATQACTGNTGGSGGSSGTGGDGGALPPGSAFLGQWSCTGTSTINFTTPAGTPPSSTPITSTASMTAAGAEILFTPTVDAGSSCQPLAFFPTGSTATLAPGQSCTQPAGQQTNVITYTGGSASIAQGNLSVLLQFTFNSTGSTVLAGTGTVTEACTKP